MFQHGGVTSPACPPNANAIGRFQVILGGVTLDAISATPNVATP